jgi:glycosyltransferase involved in cell wall biosynthesis
MKTAVLIPAYNAAKTIRAVIDSLQSMVPPTDILVVNDGSLDETEQLALDAGVDCFSFVNNQGKGACLRFGYRLLEKRGYQAAISMDADCQHDAASIPGLLQEASRGDYSLLIGNRMKSISAMPVDRILSNKFSSLLLSAVTGENLPDSQCGFRWVRLSDVNRLKLDRNRFDYESQQIVETFRNGGNTGFVTVPTRYQGGSSNIRRLRDTLAFCSVFSRALIDRIRKRHV